MTDQAPSRDPDFLWRLMMQKDEVNEALRAEIGRLREMLEHLAKSREADVSRLRQQNARLQVALVDLAQLGVTHTADQCRIAREALNGC